MQLTSRMLWLVKWSNTLFLPVAFTLCVSAQTNPFSWWNGADIFWGLARLISWLALVVAVWSMAKKKRERKVHVNSKTFGARGLSCSRDPTVLLLTHMCFPMLLAIWSHERIKKQQLSSKLAQNMHLSVFKITIRMCLGKCLNFPLTLFLLFSCTHECMLGYSCMFFKCSTTVSQNFMKWENLKGRLSIVNRKCEDYIPPPWWYIVT